MDVLERLPVHTHTVRPPAATLSWVLLLWSLVLVVAGIAEGRLVAITVGVALLAFNAFRLTSPGVAR